MDEIAKVIFKKACELGIEEINAFDTWEEMREVGRRLYRDIQDAVVVKLEELAIVGQAEDSDRGWNYTDNCPQCGGTKNFIDWIKLRERV